MKTTMIRTPTPTSHKPNSRTNRIAHSKTMLRRNGQVELLLLYRQLEKVKIIKTTKIRPEWTLALPTIHSILLDEIWTIINRSWNETTKIWIQIAKANTSKANRISCKGVIKRILSKIEEIIILQRKTFKITKQVSKKISMQKNTFTQQNLINRLIKRI